MSRRITYFVSGVEQVADGWRLHGECGLGPLLRGDTFTEVVGERQEPPAACALVISGPESVLQGQGTVEITVVGTGGRGPRPDDLLVGEMPG